MNYSDAAHLREKWGDKPCDHPEIEAEMEAEHPSKNYVCTTCGKVGEGSRWNTLATDKRLAGRAPLGD